MQSANLYKINILVYRFSAMGDVALVVPVLLGLTQQYKNVHITMVTRPKFAVFFENMERVTVFAADIDKNYKGAAGLYRLHKNLEKETLGNGEKYTAIIDLHDHLRTRILGFYAKISRFFDFFSANNNRNKTQIIVFDKGRKEKKNLIKNRDLHQLPHTTQRYANAFAAAGFPIKLPETPVFQFIAKEKQTTTSNLEQKNPKIGIAPFAKHATKEWSFASVNELVNLLINKYPNIEITFFGGGKKETEKLETLCQFYPENTVSAANKFGIKEEIALMQTLDLMICMDSSNMHLAALADVKTLSIWGATHPAAGFAAYGEGHRHIAVSPDELACRPCAVFGDKPCARGDNACMQRISANMVLEEIIIFLK